MQWIQKAFLLIASFTIWINFTSIAAEPPCDNVSKKGRLVISSYLDLEKNHWCHCDHIHEVRFKKIRIKNLPHCLLAKAEKIKSLSFSKTEIDKLPNNIKSFNQLESLDVSFTKMIFLPEEISELANLKFLNLRGTQITALPEGLEHIETIDMRMIEMSREEQVLLQSQYPGVKIYFSSPCKCY